MEFFFYSSLLVISTAVIPPVPEAQTVLSNLKRLVTNGLRIYVWEEESKCVSKSAMDNENK